MIRALLALAVLTGCSPAAPRADTAAAPVKLVVHIAIDQFRPDYLDRWRDQLHGGLGRLLRQGVVYLKGEQDHAITVTAAGHASMMSGRWPYSTGIYSNDHGVEDRDYSLLGSTSAGASPRNFRGTTLFDWLHDAYPQARALSVSRKDRAAILPVGRARQSVFWYSQGRFTTSTWYADSLPDWLERWNSTDPVGHLMGTSWTTLPGINYPEVDARPFEHDGKNFTFPHPIPDDRARAAHELEYQPVMDSLTLDVAWHGIRAMNLGGEGHPDFLAISLSTTDAIGHRYGPGSVEIHDQVLRLDRQLDWFLDSLAKVVPGSQMVLSLTADHGVEPYPETDGTGGVSFGSLLKPLAESLRNDGIADPSISAYEGLIRADTAALSAHGISVDSTARALAARIRAIKGVRKVFTPRTLPTSSDVDAHRWHNQIPPDVAWLVAVSIDDGWVFGSGRSAGHGTTNLLDRRVPIIIVAPRIKPRQVDRVVGVVDIAPTVAAIIGVHPTQPLDGVVLPELVSSRR